MATGKSPEQLKKEVEEAAKAGDRKKIMEIGKDADPEELYTIILPTGANASAETQQKLQGVNAIVKFVIEGEGGGTFWIKVSGGKVEGGKGEPPAPANATITQSIDTFRKVQARQLDPQMAFMQGLLKISGDMGVIMRLAQLMR
jgi:putative sterol carrier protein